MADFCKACSIQLFGEDWRELAGITNPERWANGEAAGVICEGCGPIQVDPEGNCVSKDCICKGKPGHGLPWVTSNSTSAVPGLSEAQAKAWLEGVSNPGSVRSFQVDGLVGSSSVIFGGGRLGGTHHLHQHRP